jgi:hypothetical protein
MESILVTPPSLHLPPPPANDSADLLRQLVDLQRQQVELLKAQQASPEERTRAFCRRHAGEFADLPAACKRAVPALERAYLALLAELTDKLADDGAEALGNEFAVAEFLDRFGPRLMQLGGVLGQVSQVASVAPADGV